MMNQASDWDEDVDTIEDAPVLDFSDVPTQPMRILPRRVPARSTAPDPRGMVLVRNERGDTVRIETANWVGVTYSG